MNDNGYNIAFHYWLNFWSFCEFIKVFALGMWCLKLLILCYEWQQGPYRLDLGKCEGYSRLIYKR
jgi:hypothetical protein